MAEKLASAFNRADDPRLYPAYSVAEVTLLFHLPKSGRDRDSPPVVGQ